MRRWLLLLSLLTAPGLAPVQARAQQAVDESRRNAIVRAAERVAPAVVSVNTVRRERVRPQTLWERFFLPPGAAEEVTGSLPVAPLGTSSNLLIGEWESRRTRRSTPATPVVRS